MNTTTAIVSTVGVIVAAMFGYLGVAAAKRSEKDAKISNSNAKLTKRYFDDAAFNVELVDVLRDDYWAVADTLRVVVSKHNALIEGLPRVYNGDPETMAAFLRSVGPIPEPPKAQHPALMKARREARQAEDDEGEDA